MDRLVYVIFIALVILMLYVGILFPFVLIYGQSFLMYRNRFDIESNIYKGYIRAISFADSVRMILGLYFN